MASIAQPVPVTATYAGTGVKPQSGVWSWLTTVDHKRIGILYGVTALFFFLVGGLEALVIRAPACPAEQRRRQRRDATTSSSRCTARR